MSDRPRAIVADLALLLTPLRRATSRATRETTPTHYPSSRSENESLVSLPAKDWRMVRRGGTDRISLGDSKVYGQSRTADAVLFLFRGATFQESESVLLLAFIVQIRRASVKPLQMNRQAIPRFSLPISSPPEQTPIGKQPKNVLTQSLGILPHVE